MTAALADGRPVHVSAQPRCYLLNQIIIPSRRRLFGDGASSCLRFSQKMAGDFVLVRDATDVTLDGLMIDGNYHGALTSEAWAIEIVNSEQRANPRRNFVAIRNCYIKGNGFGAVSITNGHDVVVSNNIIQASTDSGIAVLEGSSDVRVSDNKIRGASYGISVSSEGEKNLAIVGFTHDVEIKRNRIWVTKLDAAGIEVDGVYVVTIANNTINLDGGKYGMRFVGVADTNSRLEISKSIIIRNVVRVIQDGPETAYEFYGTGDINNSRVSDNIASAVFPQRRSTGLAIEHGVSARIDDQTISNLGYGVRINPSDAPYSHIVLSRLTITGTAYGIDALTDNKNLSNITLIGSKISKSRLSDVLQSRSVKLNILRAS